MIKIGRILIGLSAPSERVAKRRLTRSQKRDSRRCRRLARHINRFVKWHKRHFRGYEDYDVKALAEWGRRWSEFRFQEDWHRRGSGNLEGS